MDEKNVVESYVSFEKKKHIIGGDIHRNPDNKKTVKKLSKI